MREVLFRKPHAGRPARAPDHLDARIRPFRGAPAPDVERARVGGPRGGAAHPRAGSRTPVRRVAAAEDGVAGAAGHLRPGRLRRRRAGLRVAGPGQRGAGVRRHVAARDPVGARRPELADAAGLGHRGAEAAVSRAAGAGPQDRHLRPDRARRPAAMPAASRPWPSAAATATSSPARRCGSRSPTWPITSWCSPGATWRRSGSATRRASAPSSSSAPSRASRAAR